MLPVYAQLHEGAGRPVLTPAFDWVELTESFLPRIEAACGAAERERRLPHELVLQMAEAGLFRLKLPTKYGGAEVDHVTYYRVVEQLARTHASAAWLVVIANENATAAGYLPAEAADEIFGADPNIILAGAIKSRHDQVRPVDGGYRVRGQWALASGCPERHGSPPPLRSRRMPDRALDPTDGRRSTSS